MPSFLHQCDIDREQWACSFKFKTFNLGFFLLVLYTIKWIHFKRSDYTHSIQTKIENNWMLICLIIAFKLVRIPKINRTESSMANKENEKRIKVFIEFQSFNFNWILFLNWRRRNFNWVLNSKSKRSLLELNEKENG